MEDLKELEKKIIKTMKEHGSMDPFFLGEKRFDRERVNKILIDLFEKGNIEIKRISSWGPEVLLIVASIGFKESPQKGD